MIIVTIARKPMNSSVARNALAYGTGGLNINASRVAMSKNDAEAIEKGPREIKFDRKPGISLMLSINPMPVLPAIAHPDGRWPPNVILEHKDGCHRKGTKEIAASKNRPNETRPGGRSPGVPLEERPNSQRTPLTRYGDANGREKVDIWECVNGCPILEIDVQTGISKTSKDDGSRGTGGIWHESSGVPCGPRYGDIGTAARYFKQVGGAR